MRAIERLPMPPRGCVCLPYSARLRCEIWLYTNFKLAISCNFVQFRAILTFCRKNCAKTACEIAQNLVVSRPRPGSTGRGRRCHAPTPHFLRLHMRAHGRITPIGKIYGACRLRGCCLWCKRLRGDFLILVDLCRLRCGRGGPGALIFEN